jgi:20S proteasome alpha/beta subunit
MDHNGGSVIAMAGKDCVAIASDLRLGAGAMTVASNFEKVSHRSPLSHDIPYNPCTYERRSFL